MGGATEFQGDLPPTNAPPMANAVGGNAKGLKYHLFGRGARPVPLQLGALLSSTRRPVVSKNRKVSKALIYRNFLSFGLEIRRKSPVLIYQFAKNPCSRALNRREVTGDPFAYNCILSHTVGSNRRSAKARAFANAPNREDRRSWPASGRCRQGWS